MHVPASWSYCSKFIEIVWNQLCHIVNPYCNLCTTKTCWSSVFAKLLQYCMYDGILMQWLVNLNFTYSRHQVLLFKKEIFFFFSGEICFPVMRRCRSVTVVHWQDLSIYSKCNVEMPVEQNSITGILVGCPGVWGNVSQFWLLWIYENIKLGLLWIQFIDLLYYRAH